ncbi:DUF6221 family protein [Amycolatopsis sp. cmx-4-83]|uniref:DUF6221 family protein n=1 Tax=Amycolatopsis sp. cmx-4-83 TaxID=2790940 RepID=UPI003979D6E7
MDDLITWLRAQLDEDERIATQDGVLAGDTWHVLELLPGRVTAEVMRLGGTVAKLEEHDAEHMARHDPARVRREVEAKRAIIDMHQPDIQFSSDQQFCRKCATGDSCDDCLDYSTQVWPCSTLRLLALPLADLPGYREEWKP